MASNKTGGKVSGGGEIKVWGMFQTGIESRVATEESNSTVSRIKFGVRIKDIKKKRKIKSK